MRKLHALSAKVMLIFGLTYLLTTSIYAQGADKRRNIERIQEFKQQYIKEVLALSDEDAAAFFPLYDSYEEERAAHRKKLNNLKVGFMAKTDEQLEEDLNAMLVIKNDQLETEKKYYQKFKEVLSIRQVAALYYAENQFRKKLLERFGDNN
ncbi:MAG: hypothetical protein CMO01_20735 [Thalassobius sp.]|nr:hypothetical protein [Thalassovita sp.]